MFVDRLVKEQEVFNVLFSQDAWPKLAARIEALVASLLGPGDSGKPMKRSRVLIDTIRVIQFPDLATPLARVSRHDIVHSRH